MDDYVCDTLTNWGLRDHIKTFKDERIDKESFGVLSDEDINKLFPAREQRAMFIAKYKQFKVQPSTSKASHRGRTKRKAEDSSKCQSPAKVRCDTDLDTNLEMTLAKAKETMAQVQNKLEQENKEKETDFIKSLLEKIKELKEDKKELVGVFGKSGAGKSSLINAILEEKDLLPTAQNNACTAVMIKVEANMDNSKYEAEVEFITETEWSDDLWFMYNLVKKNQSQESSEENDHEELDDEENDEEDDKEDEEEDEEEEEEDEEEEDEDDDEEYDDFVSKMSALYDDEWKHKTPEALMTKQQCYKEIKEFFQEGKKTFTCESASELSQKIKKYTRSAPTKRTKGEWYYWPLVKCVTIKVPNKKLLEHVTLVDLPGNGDCNKSRDEMWKEHVGNCSTVWVVTDMTRPATDKGAWKILKRAHRHMGNQGECQRIDFICTKSDHVNATTEQTFAQLREQTKDDIRKKFNKLKNVKKHINCFDVFTVSSEEFLNKTKLEPEETEIPDVQKILGKLSDCQTRAEAYVSGARGILSLIQGVKNSKESARRDACKDLEKNLKKGHDKVKAAMENASKNFEKRLNVGIKNSKRSYKKDLNTFLNTSGDGRGFHKILACVVRQSGIYQPKKSNEMNLNATLAQHLTKSIENDFRNTFPNKKTGGAFKGAITNFTLVTNDLVKRHKDVELLLTFLQSDEMKIKIKLNNIIREKKKTIFGTLAETIKNNMEDCYKSAKSIKGKGMLEKIRQKITTHVTKSQEVMFQEAKETMLKKMEELKKYILMELEKKLKDSIDLSLRTNPCSIPDFQEELDTMTKYYNDLKLVKK